jgi:hypothetical protein
LDEIREKVSFQVFDASSGQQILSAAKNFGKSKEREPAL